MPSSFGRGASLGVAFGIVASVLSACGGSEDQGIGSTAATTTPATAPPLSVAPTTSPTTAAPQTSPPPAQTSTTQTESGLPITYQEVLVIGDGDGISFSAPNHLALDADDNLYVTEFVGGRVWVLSPSGELRDQFAGPGDGIGELSGPTGIAIDADGNVYIGESGTSRVQKFGPDGAPLASWGGFGIGPGEFGPAMGVGINDALGRAYVADYVNSRVQVFDLEGTLLFMFGDRGPEPGQMFLPIGLDIGPDGVVYVVDSGNSRVQTYTAEGEFIDVFSTLPLFAPQVISVREDGSFWVAGPADREVVYFSERGEPLASLIPAEGSLAGPLGAETASDGTVWLADTGNHVVRAFRPAD